MIVIVVPNPALDKTVVIPGFAVGRTYRAQEVVTLAGGKGFNFARVLRTLGEQSLVVCPIGGHGGQRLLELAVQEGLECDGLAVKAEVRTCLTIIDPAANNRLTEVYEHGISLEEGEWESLVERAASHFARARFLAVCGSFPPGTTRQSLYDLLHQAKAASLPVLLDISGPQLADALDLKPALLKINQFEAGEVVGWALATPAQALDAATDLQKRGAREVVITLGKQGAIGLTSEGRSFGWKAPAVDALCPIGSGDSLFAGIAAALAQGQSLPGAARMGVAAGAANTLQIGAGCLERQQVEQLLQSVKALPLDHHGQQ
jgi:1-phosphofructokinase family hexose kinase